MGLSYLYKSRLRAVMRHGSILTLTITLVLAPFSRAQADMNPLSSQVLTQGINSFAGPASQALGAITSMQGANSMARGKQQMACCKEGCDGAGKEATGNKAGQDGAARSLGNDVNKMAPGSAPSQPSPAQQLKDGVRVLWNHDVPKPLALLCTRSAPRAKMLFDLFRPQPAEAMAGCNDALMSMAQGAMQMLSGLAGMMAGMQANKNGAKAGGNASNLGATPTSSVSSAPAQVAGASLNGNNGNGSAVTIDPALLRDGKGASIASEFERTFGIPREDFANALANGVDPRQLLMNAPKNAFTADELNQAFAAAKNMSPEQKEAALAAAGLGDLQRDLAGKTAEAISTAGGKSPTKYSSSSKELDDLGDLMGKTDEPQTGSLVNSDLSPELQAALANREQEQMRDNSSIFMVVHRKYQQKMRMIYGFDAYGKSIGGKGVANADGF